VTVNRFNCVTKAAKSCSDALSRTHLYVGEACQPLLMCITKKNDLKNFFISNKK